MPAGAAYGLRRAGLADLPLLSDWQARPHVRRWWDAGAPMDAEKLADARVARWIVALEGRPFAYMQDYAVHGWPDHPFAYLPAGARGMDQYIAAPEMLGQGHGTGMIRARLAQLFAQGAPVVVVDPHPENARAIACYRRCGFRAEAAARQMPWGLVLPMTIRAGGAGPRF